MLILGIETSCDETAAAIVKDGKTIVSNVVASSQEIHEKYGGIIPEIAARQQLTSIIPVISEALGKGLGWDPKKTTAPPAIDAIAVTAGGPGLIGSLLVGIETAKTLALIWNKPIVPVTHFLAHVYANWIDQEAPPLPAIVLTVSGGHTDLLLMINHGSYKWLGGTRDDSAGDAFDKCARLLGLEYPGGPAISKLADRYFEKNPDRKLTMFPRPMKDTQDYDFSFSGLKTAVSNIVRINSTKYTKPQLAAEIQEAIIDSLIHKTLKAEEEYKPKSLLLAGGVAANKRLREKFESEISASGGSKNLRNSKSKIDLRVPPPALCTDNATFIAAWANFNYKPIAWDKIEAIPDAFEAAQKYGNLKNRPQ